MFDAEIGFILSAIGQYTKKYNKFGLDSDKKLVEIGFNLLEKLEIMEKTYERNY